MSKSQTPLAGTLAALAGGALFGLLGPLARYASDAGVPGVAFTAWRALLGAAFVFVLLLAGGRVGASFAAVRNLPRSRKAAFALAALMNTIVNMAVFTAFGLIPVALALMLLYTYPAGVVAFDILTGRERPTLARLAALALSLVGVALVLFGGANAGLEVNLAGVALSLLASACLGVYLMLNRHGYPTVPADAAVLGILVTAFGISSVVAVVIGQGGGLMAPLASPEPWPSIVVAGVAAAGLASILFISAARSIGGSRTGILMLIEPVVGVVLSAVLLGEALGPVQALGGVLVLAGALVLQFDAPPGLEPMGEPTAGPVG